MSKIQISRREMLLRCAALGSLTVSPGLSVAEAATRWLESAQHAPMSPTPWNEIGPFYKRRAPHSAHLRVPGDPGLPLLVSGAIYATDGNLIPEATLEIWHSDHHGKYDLEGYRYRTSLVADAKAKYSFDSIMPGHYPDRVCQHVHYRVTAPGFKPLTTQLYFATDPVFEGNPDKNFTRDPLILSRELIRPVALKGDPNEIRADVEFSIALERL